MHMQRSKFNSQSVVVAGLRFDSKAESERWCQLQALQQAGRITDLKRQVRFVFPLVTDTGRRYAYVADFQYCDETGQLVVEDVKGHETEVSKIKRALMRHFFNIDVILYRKRRRLTHARLQ
jgi:hypothetical protein